MLTMRNAESAQSEGLSRTPGVTRAPAHQRTGEERETSAATPLEDLGHALHEAQESERAFARRLHRVHDPKGIELLRGLRARIASLKERLRASHSH